MQTHDLSYFFMAFRIMVVYQTTRDTLELKKRKNIDYVLSCKSKGLCASKFKSLYTAFLHNIKSVGYRMGIKQ